MKTIWKFEIALEATQAIEMPRGAEIISVQFQHGVMCLWAIVDSNAAAEQRIIQVFGTGHDFKAHNRKHLATLVQGAFVWHVFERLKS